MKEEGRKATEQTVIAIIGVVIDTKTTMDHLIGSTMVQATNIPQSNLAIILYLVSILFHYCILIIWHADHAYFSHAYYGSELKQCTVLQC